jgi:hypothetical protein
MIKLKIAKNLSPQMFVFCLVCMASCSSMTKTQKMQTAESLVPQSIVENLKKTYSPEEMNLINIDLKNIRETSFLGKIRPGINPIYVATAGGPGACKSTILETYLHDKQNFVYVDPDQRTLKYMINTYCQSTTNYEISKQPSYGDVQKNAYTKWRDASNYIADTLLNEAFADGYNIAHGTTSTSSAIGSLYKKIKQRNYKIVLLLCYATDETRVAANAQRQGFFFQATPEDTINKGKMFPERFPIYFKYADEIHIYWTDDFLNGSKHAATYNKNQGFVIYNSEAMNNFIKKYDDDRKNLPNLPSFDKLIQTKK